MASGIFAFAPYPPPSEQSPEDRAAEDALIEKWLRKHKPRRFEIGDTSHPMLLLEWMVSRGYDAKHVRRSRPWKVNGKYHTLHEFFMLVDRERVKAGLPPLTPWGRS